MYLPLRLSFFGLLGSILVVAQAQSTVPTLNQPIASPTMAAGGAASSFDLRTVFVLPGVSGQVVQFDTVSGKFNVELLADAAPRHVANFLNYVQNGLYTNSIFHRVASFDGVQPAIAQGGGFRTPITNGTIPGISKFAPIALEYNLPNARGTIAAARTNSLNSATSEWYFNLQDNSTVLGAGNNGGYSVFGRVLGSGMSVVDTIGAFPRVNVGSPFTELPVRNFPGGTVSDQHLIVVPSISKIALYPNGLDSSVVTFTAETSAASIASVALSGSSLAVTPRNPGSANIVVRATDTNGNNVDHTFTVNVMAGSAFTAQPTSQSVTAGNTVTLTATATGALSYQWQRNGVDIAGATNATYSIPNVQPEHAGIYVALASNGAVTSSSRPAAVGVVTTTKFTGTVIEYASDIPHQNNNIYDQMLLTGAAATVRADPGQVVRTSYIDLNDDIVQVEFGGAGSLTIMLENSSGPATPVKYNQSISYMKGRASIVVTGADASTNLLVFSVGRGTAVNQALFRDDVTYDATADIAFVAISANGNAIASLRTANASYAHTRGFVGVHAPGVRMEKLFIGDISASDTASPIISLAGSDDARITGGDLFQNNARAIQIDGLTRLAMTAGTNSHDIPQVAQPTRGRLERNGTDVTNEVIVPAN